MKKLLNRGMGIGGWLTNYKRFHVLSEEQKKVMTVGDFEHFNSYITEKDVKYIASLGFDHIRVCFDQIVLEEAPGRYRENILCLIDNFFAWCKKYDLAVVLNLHKAVGNYCDVDDEKSLLESDFLQDNFVDLWTMLDARYKDDNGIIFELLNEVKLVPAELWNNLAKRTIDAIRAQNKDRQIIVGTICWNNLHFLKDLAVYDDDKVYYTFHMYEPFEFTHQRGVLHQPTCFYNRDMPYPCDIERYRDYQRVARGSNNPYPNVEKMDREYIWNYMQPVAEFRKKHPDKLLWCGEFGTIRHCKMQWREQWFKDVISFLKHHEVGYSVWNYLSTPYDGNRFSLVDDESRQILSENLKNILLGDF